MLRLSHGAGVGGVAGVECAGGLEEEDVDLFGGYGAMFDASGAVPRVVFVPDELTLEFDQLDLLAV